MTAEIPARFIRKIPKYIPESARGHFQTVDVKTGERAGDMLPITSGLKTGARVVVDGAMLLRAQ